jgi:hypothetical protein
MKRLILKTDGLNGVGPAPAGFKYVGLDDRGQISEKEGSSIKQISGDGIDPRDFIIQKSSKESDILFDALSRGIIQPNTGFDLPDDGVYVLSSVETYLKFAEAVGMTGDPYNSLYPFGSTSSVYNVNVSASVETYLKYAEAGGNLNVSYGLTDFSENFISLINNTSYLDRTGISDAEFLDRFLDKGIVEFGSFNNKSKLDYYDVLKNFNMNIEDYLKYSRTYNTIFPQFLDKILDKGIVVYVFNGIMSISSVETSLKLIEAQRDQENKEEESEA